MQLHMKYVAKFNFVLKINHHFVQSIQFFVQNEYYFTQKDHTCTVGHLWLHQSFLKLSLYIYRMV